MPLLCCTHNNYSLTKNSKGVHNIIPIEHYDPYFFIFNWLLFISVYYIGAKLVPRHPDLFNWTKMMVTQYILWVGIKISHAYTTAHADSSMSPLQVVVKLCRTQFSDQISNAKSFHENIQQ